MAQKWNQKQAHPHVTDSPNSPMTVKSRSPSLLGHCSCQLHKSCADEKNMENVCSFPNITLHQNNSLLSVKHLAVHILTRNYWRRQYTGNNTSGHKVFIFDNCSSRNKTAEVTAVPKSSNTSAAIMKYVCKNQNPSFTLFKGPGKNGVNCRNM
jgi:hypothetical protein